MAMFDAQADSHLVTYYTVRYVRNTSPPSKEKESPTKHDVIKPV